MPPPAEGRQEIEHIVHRRCRQQIAHDEGEPQPRTVQAAQPPQLFPLLRVVFAHHDGTQEGSRRQECQQAAHRVARPVAQRTPAQGQQRTEGYEDDRRAEGEISPHLTQQCHEKFLPQPPAIGQLILHTLPAPPREVFEHVVRHDALHPLAHGTGGPDHIGREEGGDDTDGHHHRVEKTVRHAERGAQRGDDEGELANLCQRETAPDGRAQGLAGEEEAARAEHGLSQHDGQADDHDGQGVAHEHGGVDQHAHRHEEDGAEKVLHRRHHAPDVLRLYRFGQNAAHHERAEGGTVAHPFGEHHEQETQPDAHHEQCLAVHPPVGFPQEQGHDVNAHHEPQDEEEGEFQQTARQFKPLQVAAHGQRAEYDHEKDAQDVLQDEHGEHLAGKFLLPQPEVVESLVDNRGTRHGEHAAQEEAVHAAPPEEMTHTAAHAHHAEHHATGGDDGTHAHLHDFLERKFQTEGEHEEYHADVGPRLYAPRVADGGGVRHVGAGQETGHDVAEHERLLEAFEEEGDDASGDEDECQVGDEVGHGL